MLGDHKGRHFLGVERRLDRVVGRELLVSQIRKARGKAYEYHAVRFTDPGTGKEKIRYFRSHKDAVRVRTEIENRVSGGTYSADAHKVTVREIAERWRKAAYSPRRADALRSTTAQDYETTLVRYILPRWGAVRLVDIRAGQLETWRNELLEKGVEPEWKPIGASTVRKALLVLGIVFRFAMRDHVVAVNPVSFVKKPPVRTRKAAEERLLPEQLAKLFEVATRRTRIVIRIAATTGMREGEILGLRWRDVDTKARLIQVRRQYTHGEFVEHAKTDAGRRDIGIDAKLGAERSDSSRTETKNSLELPSSSSGVEGMRFFCMEQFWAAAFGQTPDKRFRVS